MGTWFRSRHGLDYEQGFIQGAGRVIVATEDHADAEDVSDFFVLASGGTQYDAASGWTDVGFTKTGINITRNNAEEDFTVDQVRGSIKRRPTNWEMSVGTQLAEASLETFALAWELGGEIEDVTPGGGQLAERHLGMGAPLNYTTRQVAVGFQFPDDTIRVFWFRKCNRAPQESGFTLQPTGEQVSLPQRWTCLADDSQPVEEQFGMIFEQVPA